MVALSKQDSAQTDAPPGIGAGGTSSGTPDGGGTMPDIAARRFVMRSSRLTKTM